MSQISDETLMAFADGVLADAEFNAVAEAVEADPAVAARLQALVEGADLAKRGYSVLMQPVPPSLDSTVRAAIAKARGRPRWHTLWGGINLIPAGAAAIAFGVALVALPLGYTLGQFSVAPSATLTDVAIAQVLDRLPSGQPERVSGDVTIIPVATFTDETGNVCREYETSGKTSSVQIACRLGGTWQTQLIIATGNNPGYRPASGSTVVDAYLDSIGAGQALLDAEELAVLGQSR